jgi:peptidoglycan-associated lipoprotein
MKRNIYISLVFILMVSLSVEAQPVRSVPYHMMLDAAEISLERNDYYNAVEWFDKCYKESRDKNIAIKLAELNYELRDYKRSAGWYKRILSRDRENLYGEYRFNYGKALKMMGDYQGAIDQFLIYDQETSNEEQRLQTYAELKGIKMSGELNENIEVAITLGDRKVNSAFTEFSPYLHPDGNLYFSSFQRKDPIVLDGKEEDYHSKIYYTKKGDKGYEKPTPLGNHINREGFHTGNVCFSKDGNRMFFTRAELEGNQLLSSDIFVSYKSEKGWSAPTKLEGVNGDFISKHPSVGELFGNEVLFFSTNMDGGEGGYDIFYSTLRGEQDYSAAVNLGPSINTKQDEVTPFYVDGTLYFSSDGHPSLGGFDIYSTTWNGSSWSEISNIGFGYNTTYDDLYLTLDESGTKGYLVSNRPDPKKRTLKSKTCCDDIYEISIRETVIDLLATVFNKEGPLEGASIMLKDLTKQDAAEPESKSNFSANDFSFLLNADHAYRVVVTREGYLPDSVEFNTVGILDDYTVKKKITLVAEEPEEIIEIVTINQPIRLNNIYYDFDDDKILLDAETDLNTLLGLLNQYPDMVIELSSHTDAQGVSTYNQKLSQRRADSAVRWLIDKGVPSERVQPVGYGESQILNRCVNGVRCSDEEHRFNRRTEFKIIAGPQSIEIKKQVVKKRGE